MNQQTSPDRKPSPAPPKRPVPAGPLYHAPGAPRGALFGPGDLDLRRMLHVLLEKWTTVAAAVLFALIAATFHLLIASKTYRAVSLVELSVRRPRIAGQQGAVIDDSQGYGESEETFNTWLERFRSRSMHDLAVGRFRESGLLGKVPDDKVRKMLGSRVNMSLVRHSRLMKITFDDTDPVLAAAGANAFADAAAQLAFEENKQAADNAVSWLQSQAQIGRRELEKADQALVKFHAENNVDDLESRKKNASEALLELNRSLVDIESQEVLARDLYNTLEALDLDPEKAGKLPASIPRAPEIQAMLEKWLTAVSARDALLTKYTAKHPEVVAQNKVIDVLREQAMEAISRGKDTARANVALLDRQAGSLRQRMAEYRRTAAEVDLKLVEMGSALGTLERARDAADISYKGILNRIEEARLSADENTATVKIVERAIPPEKHIWPSRKIVLLVWLFVGLGFGAGLALLTDLLEDYVTSAADLETGVGIGILALVPHLEGVRREDLATACLTDKFSQFAEAFAGIRASLDSSRYKDISRTVLIASTAPGEGKTITASNLAIMCAKSGMRTLLIDFDMRRPHMDKVFGMPKQTDSLIQVLSKGDRAAFSRLPFKSLCEGLEVVASRPDRQLSPAEIIGSRAVRDLIEWAVASYDRVIVDSPPFSVVSDAAVLSDLVPCVLIVCRQGHSRKRAMRRAVEHLREAGANIIGAVVNDVKFQKGFFSGDFEGYYGHYNYHKYFGDAGRSPDA